MSTQSKLEIANEPAHEIMALFILPKLILQTRMRSHPVGLEVRFLVRLIVYFHTSCVRTAKALARLRRCAGSPEPSLVPYVISTKISWASSNETPHDQTNKMICVPTKDSDQPEHLPSLINLNYHEEAWGPWLPIKCTGHLVCLVVRRLNNDSISVIGHCV